MRTSGRKLECASDTEASSPFKRTSAYQAPLSDQQPSSETPSRHRSSIRMEVSLNDVPTPEEERPERDVDAKRKNDLGFGLL